MTDALFPPHDAGGPPPGEIREELERILASRRFVRAARHARFLRYVVEQTLAGRGAGLKESLLGLEVFDRPADYDPRIDPVVRVEATKLRARLEEYYRDEGAGSGVRIGFPRGGYVPTFRRCDFEVDHRHPGDSQGERREDPAGDGRENETRPTRSTAVSDSVTSGSGTAGGRDSRRTGADTQERSGGSERRVGLPGQRFGRRGVAAGLAACTGAVMFGAYWWATGAGEAPSAGPAVAVLPFEDLGLSDASRPAVRALAAELANRLAKSDVRVISKTSAFSAASPARSTQKDARAIGRLLGAGLLVEGGMREAAGQLHITVQLVDTGTGLCVWSGTYADEGVDASLVGRIGGDILGAIEARSRVRAGARGWRRRAARSV